ncbi:hypothetical protein QL285_039507 [Trifolium repens]|nr:hypothetical protein QL285_039507 [Trifolium repens]
MTKTKRIITKLRTPKEANKIPLILNVPHMTLNPEAAATNSEKQYKRERQSIAIIGTRKFKDQTTTIVYKKLTVIIPVQIIAGKNPMKAFPKPTTSICELFFELID